MWTKILYKYIYIKKYTNPKMDNSQGPNNTGVKVKVSELIKKFRTKKDIYDFCRENSKIFFLILDKYFTEESGYDTSYFIKYLKGEKCVCIYL